MGCKMLVVFVVTAMLAACGHSVHTEKTDNPDYQLETLFTRNGCTVYRFFDVRELHWFSDCTDAISHRMTAGKDQSRDETVQSLTQRGAAMCSINGVPTWCSAQPTPTLRCSVPDDQGIQSCIIGAP